MAGAIFLSRGLRRKSALALGELACEARGRHGTNRTGVGRCGVGRAARWHTEPVADTPVHILRGKSGGGGGGAHSSRRSQADTVDSGAAGNSVTRFGRPAVCGLRATPRVARLHSSKRSPLAAAFRGAAFLLLNSFACVVSSESYTQTPPGPPPPPRCGGCAPRFGIAGLTTRASTWRAPSASGCDGSASLISRGGDRR